MRHRARQFVTRLVAALGRHRTDADLNAEIQTHLDALAAEHERLGMSPRDARFAARRDFGGLDQMKEQYRDQRGVPVIDALRLDARYALRMFRKNPGFAAVAVLTLAIGIGANTALFSVVNAVLLRPLPYPHADRLLAISAGPPARPLSLLSFDEYLAVAEAPSLESTGLWLSQSVNLTGGANPERITGNFVTASYFDVLGLKPERGRFFLDGESAPGRAQPFAVISHAFWQRRFGGAETILNETLTLNGTAFRVIGVMALPFDADTVPGAGGPIVSDVFVPAGGFPGRNNLSTNGPSLLGVARMKPGVELAAVTADLDVISRRLKAAFPQTQADRTTRAMLLQESLVGRSRTSLLLLLAVVGAVLLIACVNVANLLLARAVDRQREIALRVALGAGRGAVVRQFGVEAALLTLTSAVIGSIIGRWSLGALVSIGTASLPIPVDIPLDATVLLFTVVVSTTVAFLCAVVPAFKVSALDPAGALQAGSRGSTGGGRRTREGLVIVELALSVALVAVSGLLLKSLMAVERAPLGFAPDHVFTLSFRLPPSKYPAKRDIARFFHESIERVRAIPGIESAALVRAVPLSGNGGEIAFTAEGQPVAKGSEPQARYHLVTPDYFRTMKITLRSGRDFSDADTLESPAVAVVNQTLARNVWPGGDAIGKRITTADMPDWLTVVGVVNDAVHANPTERPQPQIYVSHYQNPLIFSSLVARTAQAPMSVMNDVRNAIWSVDKDQPVWATMSLDAIVANVRAPDRLLALLIGIFAAVAVAIASVGVYGVMAYSVSQRTQEIGIRLALGASPSLVRRDVIVRALSLVGFAVVGGLVIAVMGARIASSVLVGVQPTDPTALGAAGVVLALVAIAACYVPARRASRVDPLIALRQD